MFFSCRRTACWSVGCLLRVPSWASASASVFFSASKVGFQVAGLHFGSLSRWLAPGTFGFVLETNKRQIERPHIYDTAVKSVICWLYYEVLWNRYQITTFMYLDWDNKLQCVAVGWPLKHPSPALSGPNIWWRDVVSNQLVDEGDAILVGLFFFWYGLEVSNHLKPFAASHLGSPELSEPELFTDYINGTHSQDQAQIWSGWQHNQLTVLRP